MQHQDGLFELQEKLDDITGRDGYSEHCTLTYATCSDSNPYQAYKTSPDCCVQTYTNLPAVVGSGTYNDTDSIGCFLPKSPISYFAKYGDPNFEDIEGTLKTMRDTSDTDFANMITM